MSIAKPGERILRTVDSKARVPLPRDFIGATVEVEQVDQFEIRIRRVVVVPEREAWLHRNPAALQSVIKGMEQAKAGQVVAGPSPADLARMIEEIPDEE